MDDDVNDEGIVKLLKLRRDIVLYLWTLRQSFEAAHEGRQREGGRGHLGIAMSSCHAEMKIEWRTFWARHYGTDCWKLAPSRAILLRHRLVLLRCAALYVHVHCPCTFSSPVVSHRQNTGSTGRQRTSKDVKGTPKNKYMTACEFLIGEPY